MRPFRLGQETTPPERPSGVIGKADALDVIKKLGQVLETAPECFEGEDLTVAKSIIDRLKEFSSSERAIMGLSEGDEKVLKRGLDCFTALDRSKASSVPGSSESKFPIIPVAIGAGVGVILLVLIISG